LRDEVAALERLQERQRVEHSRKYDQDIISYAIDGGNVYLMLFKVYRGTLEGRRILSSAILKTSWRSSWSSITRRMSRLRS